MRLVVCDVEPVAHILRSSWATHLLNFASWDSIVSLFPTSALRKKQMFVFSAEGECELRLFDKYIECGFVRIRPGGFSWSGEFKKRRFIGDEYTVRVQFSGRFATDLELLDHAFEVGEGGIRLVGQHDVSGMDMSTEGVFFRTWWKGVMLTILGFETSQLADGAVCS